MSLPPDVEEEVEPPGEPEPMICAACGSAAIYRRKRALIFAVIAFIAFCIGVGAGQTEVAFFAIAAAGIFAMISDRWVCEECGATWK